MTRQTLAEEKEFVKILWYGDPGTGKTTSSASLAKLGKVIHVAADPGLKAKPLLELGIPIGNIEVERDITYDGLDKLFWELKGMIEDGGPDAPVGVLWDSVSEAHKKLLEQTAQKGYEKAVANNKDRGRHDVFLEDYGTNTGEMRYFMRRFLDLECHVGFAALPRRDQDTTTGAVSYGPDLTPALAMALLGYVDIVCRTFLLEVEGDDEPEYWGQFRPVGAWQAKDRFHAMPPKLINPSFDRVIAYVNGDMDVDNDPDMESARAKRNKGTAKVGEPVPAGEVDDKPVSIDSAAIQAAKDRHPTTTAKKAPAFKKAAPKP